MPDDGLAEKELMHGRAESTHTLLPASVLFVSAFRRRRPRIPEDPRERHSGTRRRWSADGGSLPDDSRAHGLQGRPQSTRLIRASMAESLAEYAAVCDRRRGGRLLRGRHASRVFGSHGVEREECVVTDTRDSSRSVAEDNARVHCCVS